ncbi:hypothetical protein [Humisphaera borealis]|uniref:Uncharacterized protein n=1 Tax=Humisphaera borealis TaxID=2807512 RepID=A0A7M2WX34_9BACT|nr:hypothetical protein [Humisphaera borealis]QOV89381.1 hypothetical protein IPV69_24795 [Humisphaera borealis]
MERRGPQGLKFAGLFAAGAALTAGQRLLQAARLRHRQDGWRRSAGVVLRGPESTFILSAFGLKLPDPPHPDHPHTDPPARLAAGLHAFLAAEPAPRVRVRRGAAADQAEPFDSVTYSLGVDSWVEGAERFLPPRRWDQSLLRTHDSVAHLPAFAFVARIGPRDQVDLWARVNHVATDGVPAQELISRLEARWGIAESVTFPNPTTFAPFELPQPVDGRGDAAALQTFLDLSPLIAWRGKANKSLPEPITLSAALMWCLSRHPTFAKLQMGTTVDIPPVGDLGRGVGVISIRPGDFESGPTGLKAYVTAFNRELSLVRRRASAGCQLLDATAPIPPACARAMLHQALRQGKAFGTFALSVLKDAKVFGAPIGEIGHDDGFLALGSAALTANNGSKVACATIKGAATRIGGHPAAIREAISRIANDD